MYVYIKYKKLLVENFTTANKVLPKAGLRRYYDTFVLNRTSVCQINISVKNPRLRQFPNVGSNPPSIKTVEFLS